MFICVTEKGLRLRHKSDVCLDGKETKEERPYEIKRSNVWNQPPKSILVFASCLMSEDEFSRKRSSSDLPEVLGRSEGWERQHRVGMELQGGGCSFSVPQVLKELFLPSCQELPGTLFGLLRRDAIVLSEPIVMLFCGDQRSTGRTQRDSSKAQGLWDDFFVLMRLFS